VSNIPGETQTLPSALYTSRGAGGDLGALRLSLVAVAICWSLMSADGCRGASAATWGG